MPANYHNGGGRRAGESLTGRLGPTPGLERKVNDFPQDKYGDLRVRD